MIVSGTAGTGKSFLISVIAALLGESCLLTGTTRIAAFNICGINPASGSTATGGISQQRRPEGTIPSATAATSFE